MSKRIVLLDPLGDVLFSGESLAGQPVAAPQEEEIEPCPATLRSPTHTHDSGVFPIVKPIRVRSENEEGEHAA